MSMPHTCRCGTCGTEYPLASDPLALASANAAAFDAGVRALASAVIKIAPAAATQIAARWQEIECAALDEFLKIMRAST